MSRESATKTLEELGQAQMAGAANALAGVLKIQQLETGLDGCPLDRQGCEAVNEPDA